MTEQWWVFLHLCKQASHYFDIMTARHKSAAYRPHARSKKKANTLSLDRCTIYTYCKKLGNISPGVGNRLFSCCKKIQIDLEVIFQPRRGCHKFATCKFTCFLTLLPKVSQISKNNTQWVFMTHHKFSYNSPIIMVKKYLDWKLMARSASRYSAHTKKIEST